MSSNPTSAQQTEEPVSGVQGQGTQSEPYDQGNQADQAAGPGIEPPSGKQGKGTAEDPYDGGNEPGELPSILLTVNG